MLAGRRYRLEQIGEAAVVQLYADGFSALSIRDKTLVWHLYQAAIAGRDIYYDQRYQHNLQMRDVLEQILHHSRTVDPGALSEIRRYTKLFWINTGPYNNLTARKFVMRTTPAELLAAARAAQADGARFPMAEGEDIAQLIDRMSPLFFDVTFDPSLTNKSPGEGRDILSASANNFYAGGVTMRDLEGGPDHLRQGYGEGPQLRTRPQDKFEERYALNSRLVKRDDGVLEEEVYRVDGRYDREIRRIIGHLRAALPFASAATADALRALIRFYETGEDSDRLAYDVAWVQDQDSTVDTINGFVEVYVDPRGAKGAWEALVYYVNAEKTGRIQTLAAHAQWFEDRMPWEPRFRKPAVRGVSAKAIEVVIETGDSGPITPVGINLPNDQAIRERYGSKSVSLANVNDAYEESTPEGLRLEFCWDAAEVARAKKWGGFAQELTTNMHEVIGHGSGRMAEGNEAPPHQLLKEQFSAIEEARADLVALFFLPDPILAELGLVTLGDQPDVVRAEYEYFARNALVQLRRIREGTQIEEDHMRNRHMIVSWLMANTTSIEVRKREGKTFYVLTDTASFRDGVATLLAEVQRIKGEGDYAAAHALFETYGVHFDPAIRDEVVARVDALQLPSYTAFVMPRLEPRYGAAGEIVDVAISYPCDLEAQMLEYTARGHHEDPTYAS